MKRKEKGAGVTSPDGGCTAKDTSSPYTGCGHRDAGNRTIQDLFRCLSCGHSENADVNAAKTILTTIV